MGSALKVVLRHFLSAAIGGGAGYVAAKTGVVIDSSCVEVIATAATVGAYGAVNHGIKVLTQKDKKY